MDVIPVTVYAFVKAPPSIDDTTTVFIEEMNEKKNDGTMREDPVKHVLIPYACC